MMAIDLTVTEKLCVRSMSCQASFKYLQSKAFFSETVNDFVNYIDFNLYSTSTSSFDSSISFPLHSFSTSINMIALRAFARRVPSTVSRQSIQTFSKVSSARIHPSRPPQSWKPTTSAWSSAFSTSVVLRAEIAEGTGRCSWIARLEANVP